MVEQFSDASPCCLDSSFIGLSEQALELGEHLFDGVQIGGVWRQEEQPDARRFEQIAHTAAFMAAQVIDHDDAARLQFGDQELLDPGGEAVTVDRAIQDARSNNAIVPETGNEGQCLPMTMRHLVDQRLSFRMPAMGAGHVGLRPGFVDEDHALWVYPALDPSPAGAAADDVGPVLLFG